MKVSDLYDGPFAGQDAYVVGTGPSMALFPVDELHGKLCVLLNDAQKHFPTLGPVAFSNNRKFLSGCKLPYQVVKGRLRFDAGAERTDNHTPWDHPEFYVFSYREPVITCPDGRQIITGDKLSHLDERSLWREPDFYWNTRDGSVSIFAVQFLLLCGVRSITLVGCDCNQVGNQHYVPQKKQTQIRHNYGAYARGLTRMWREAQLRGVPLTSWTPFFGLGHHDEQFREMTAWRISQSVSESSAKKPP